jgi:tripartite-type tricarboxylate transporter receptor subunit TctC
VRFLIPYSTGGGYNFYTRLVAKYIQEKDYLGVNTQAQNVTGGGGIVGHNRIYNAEPDGYTAGIMNPDNMGKAQIVRDEVEFDLREYTFYPRIAGSTPALGVGSHVDISTGSEFIEAMANEELTVGHSGITGTGGMLPISLGLASEQYDEDVVINNGVQFDGKSGWVTSIKREEVDTMAGSYSSILPFHESGDINIILVLTEDEEPPSNTPDADTLQDVDVDNQTATSLVAGPWHRVFCGPPEIPEERAEVVRTAVREAIQDEDLQAEAENNDRPITFGASDEAQEGVRGIVETWQENSDLLEKLTN